MGVDGQEVVITQTAGTHGFVVQGSIAGVVEIIGVKVIGGAEGVFVSGSNQNTTLSELHVTDSTFVGQSTAGLHLALENQLHSLGSLYVERVVFDQSGSDGKAVGTDNTGVNIYEGIRAYGFDGGAWLEDVTVKGVGIDVLLDPIGKDASGNDIPSHNPMYGIVFKGASSNNMGTAGKAYGDGPEIGSDDPVTGGFTLNNVVIDGGFAKTAFAVDSYADISRLNVTSMDVSGARAGWGSVVNVDGVLASYDASKWGINLGSNTAALQGESPLQSGNLGSTITGTVGSDIINSKGGDDTLVGGAGNDTLFGGVGSDVISGGAGIDNVLEVTLSAGDITFTRSASEKEWRKKKEKK